MRTNGAFRIKFDDKVKELLPETLLDMKRALYEVPESRDEKVIDFKDLGWIVDFSLDSVVNLNLRKTDKANFAVFNEGNLYNNLFYKVN